MNELTRIETKLRQLALQIPQLMAALMDASGAEREELDEIRLEYERQIIALRARKKELEKKSSEGNLTRLASSERIRGRLA